MYISPVTYMSLRYVFNAAVCFNCLDNNFNFHFCLLVWYVLFICLLCYVVHYCHSMSVLSPWKPRNIMIIVAITWWSSFIAMCYFCCYGNPNITMESWSWFIFVSMKILIINQFCYHGNCNIAIKILFIVSHLLPWNPKYCHVILNIAM